MLGLGWGRVATFNQLVKEGAPEVAAEPQLAGGS